MMNWQPALGRFRLFRARAAVPALAVLVISAVALWGAAPAAAQTATNHAPTAVNDSATTMENTAVTIAVRANDTDPDGNTLSIAAVTDAPHGTAAVNANGTVAYTPDSNFTGLDGFAYVISDGHDGFSVASVAVTVTAANSAPKAVNDTATTAESTAITIAVLANDSDPDGDVLHVASLGAVTPAEAGAAALNADGTVTFTPAAAFQGKASFTYVVDDGHGSSATATVTVRVGHTVDDDEDDEDNGQGNRDAQTACKSDGWSALGFRNQGLCIAFLDRLAGHDGPPWPLLDQWTNRGSQQADSPRGRDRGHGERDDD